MHALGRFIQDLMDARNMPRPDLERASGLSRQHIHQLLDDRKTGLGRMVDDSTIAALARAFPDVGESAFIAKAAESLGVPVDRLTVVRADFDQLTDEALLGLLSKRLERSRQRDDSADTTPQPVPKSPAPAGGQASIAARRSRRTSQRHDQPHEAESRDPGAG